MEEESSIAVPIMTVLENPEVRAYRKLSIIAEVVLAARTSYGNTDEVMDTPRVVTINGNVLLSTLSEADKVAVAVPILRGIKLAAVDKVANRPSYRVDKEMESMLANNAVLANITETVESKYL